MNIESIQLISLLGLGFMLGIKHALDADHIVAISTIASQTKNLKSSSLLGISWGLGHTATLLLISLFVMLFKIKIPTTFALTFEFIVGIMLVVLGIQMLRKIFKEKIHIHAHKHDTDYHTHLHQHQISLSHNHAHKSFFIGTLHGLSGSAALILLVLATVKSAFEGMLYVAIFGIGSIIGMTIVSTVIGIPFLLTKKFSSLENSVKILAGSASIITGGMIIFHL